MIALVREVILSAITAGSMFHVAVSLSTTMGTAPARTTAAAQEMMVKDGKITWSPAQPQCAQCQVDRETSVTHRDTGFAPHEL